MSEHAPDWVTTVVAFDVNETLLDLRTLDPAFEELLGNSALRGQWFAQMLQLSFVGGLTGNYVDFRQAQEAALRMIAERAGKTVTDSDVTTMVDRMSTLPAHPEVPEALATLHGTGLKMVALVNSLHTVGQTQLSNAGIRQYFDDVISADEVRKLKPSPEPYQLVADRFAAPVSEVRLVAAHSWDISGALAAGAKAAFVARPGMVLSPIGAQPDIIGADLAATVQAIIAADV
jgi:2-haloacid dehalogenase